MNSIQDIEVVVNMVNDIVRTSLVGKLTHHLTIIYRSRGDMKECRGDNIWDSERQERQAHITQHLDYQRHQTPSISRSIVPYLLDNRAVSLG